MISSFDSPDNPHYTGGGAAVVEMIAGRLAQHFEVTVVTAARRSGTVVRDGVRYRQLPVAWAGPRAGQLLFHALLPFAARRIPHDLWIESFTPPFSTSFLPLFSRAPVVGFAQNLQRQGDVAPVPAPLFPDRAARPALLPRRGGAQPRRRRSGPPLQPGRHRAGHPERHRKSRLDERVLGRGEHILYLGRIDVWEKGLDLLLAAYATQRAGHATARRGCRHPARGAKFAALLAATGGDVRWVGHVSGQRKQDLLARSAFVVMPSRHEAFGLAALEGMSYGKPVVHFDLPTLRWMGGDVRVPPFDVAALAGEMRDLAGDEAARRELGRTAHAAAQRYGRDGTADRYRHARRGAPQRTGCCRTGGGRSVMPVNMLTEAIEQGVPLVVLSPHLDDAVLSCGALMIHAAKRTPVTVVTLFTEAGPPPYTLSARRYLRQVGAEDAESLYRQRRAEDRAALEPMGITWVHAGLTEALYRRRPGSGSRAWWVALGARARAYLPDLPAAHHLRAARACRRWHAAGCIACCPADWRAPDRRWCWHRSASAATSTMCWCAPLPSAAVRGSPTTATFPTTSGIRPTTPSSGAMAWSRRDGRG